MDYISQEELIEEVIRIRNRIQDEGKEIKNIVRRCKQLELKLSSQHINYNKLVKIKYKILKLEVDFRNSADKKFHRTVALSSYLFLFYGLALIALKYISLIYANDFLTVNFMNFLRFTLIGALGALTHLYIRGIGGENDFSYRFMIAIMFPVIFISLFYINKDKIIGVSSVNILIFAAGFSSEFILGFLNKIVEKANKVIN